MTYAQLGTAAACTILLSASPVGAESIAESEHYYQLELPTGFKRTEPSGVATTVTRVLARYKNGDAQAVIMRVSFPNRRAWQKRAEFFREVEAGVKKRSSGYRAISRDVGRLGRVPHLDLSFRRSRARNTRISHMRFLFFRTFSVSVAFELPASAPRAKHRAAQRARDSFKPYFAK